MEIAKNNIEFEVLPDEPLVSVIINVHNGEQYIEDAIQSIFAQTYKNYEIIVYDNFSTDSTADIVNRYSEIRYIKSDQFYGLGRARNEAIKHSRGQILGFLDYDDIWLPSKLKMQVPYFVDQVALTYSNTLFFGTKHNRTTPFYSAHKKMPSGMIFRELFSHYFISLESVLFRKDALSKNEKEWFPEDFSMCEEADLFLRMAYQYPFSYVPEVLSKYRVHDQQWSITRSDLFVTEQEMMLDRFKHFIPKFEKLYSKEIPSFKASIDKSKGEVFWKEKKRIKSFVCFFSAFKKTFSPKWIVMMFLSIICNYPQYVRLRRTVGRA